jgi:hypothetical protein
MEVPGKNCGRLTESYVTVQENLLETAVGTIPSPLHLEFLGLLLCVR